MEKAIGEEGARSSAQFILSLFEESFESFRSKIRSEIQALKTVLFNHRCGYSTSHRRSRIHSQPT
jgi:hypothetical protein